VLFTIRLKSLHEVSATKPQNANIQSLFFIGLQNY